MRFSRLSKIGQHQLGINGFGIRNRINLIFHMRDVAILKTTKHMGNGVRFANICQKLIAQALHLWRHHAQGRQYQRNVSRVGNISFDPAMARQFLPYARREPPHRPYWAQWCKMDNLQPAPQQFASKRIKQCGFAHIWQANNSALKTHYSFPCQSLFLKIFASISAIGPVLGQFDTSLIPLACPNMALFFRLWLVSSFSGAIAKCAPCWHERRISTLGQQSGTFSAITGSKESQPIMIFLRKIAEHMTCYPRFISGVTDTQSHPPIFLADMSVNRTNSVMSTCTTGSRFIRNLPAGKSSSS